MTSEIISIESLTYQYALTDKPALLDINLTVDRGEYLAIVGPCGAGKTIVHDNEYYTPDGTVTECKMALSDWQGKGADRGSKAARRASSG